MLTTELVEYLDTYLKIAEIADYGPQGHQVEADQGEVRKIALAVDTALPIIERAAEWGADMLLVHHGILWRDLTRIAGPFGARVRALMGHKMHLYAAHLPLDAHPEVGNNAVLARLFDLDELLWWGNFRGSAIGVSGARQPITLDALVESVNTQLNTQAVVLAHGPAEVKHLAILSGGGAGNVGDAKATGADTFITGETDHAQYYQAADYEMNVIFAGHYATETVGVKALGAHLESIFGIETAFFDFPTGM